MNLICLFPALLVALCSGERHNRAQFFAAHNTSGLLKGVLPQGVHVDTLVPLEAPLKLFGQTYSEMRVTSDGVVSFSNPVGSEAHCSGGGTPLMAVYWAATNTTRRGFVYYGEESEEYSCAMSSLVWNNFGQLFRPTSVFVVKWLDVPYNNNGGPEISYVNGFRLDFASDGDRTFALFTYYLIAWTTACGTPGPHCSPSTIAPMAGFDRGDGSPPFLLPGSCNAQDVMNLRYTSNIGVPGLHFFQVDENVQEPPTRKRLSRPGNLRNTK